ncbi:RICIN domain-containing protein [Hymenobacter weizhouensis]|uniref:RICIN domain-containing protein n=1 Tax=Hymenobacter sp. YIM 151500-1 TaxID=2987689 RepID=UPI002226E8D9|nr:RICIN domain-containing protein [Hymenobacter sp. YIM 151500-1]UYZ63619.1 RICIN domain-containing protein [Hymenobacter sp. YIM 151500-1]
MKQLDSAPQTRSANLGLLPSRNGRGWLALLLLFLLLSNVCQLRAQTTYGDRMGIGLSHLGDVQLDLVDVAKTAGVYQRRDGSGPAPVDQHGWPTTDFKTIFFDFRPFGVWWQGGTCPQCPDDNVQINLGGTYKLSFKGQMASLRNNGQPGAYRVTNLRYDSITTTTTADVEFGWWAGMLSMEFIGTQGGVRDLKLIRPGYHNRPNDLFTQEFINAVKPYGAIRFMDWTGTNNNEATFPHTIEWKDRPRITDARTPHAPWEYAVELANRTGADLWINIPVSASDDYVRQLASLLKKTLTNPQVRIYLENSNEVWNNEFSQYHYTRAAAVAEVRAELAGGPTTPLNDATTQCDPNDTTFLWVGRHHLRRTKQLGDIFVEAFSPGSRTAFGTQIRPVFAWGVGVWVPYYSCMLEWFEHTYGAGSARTYLYGVGGTHYINDSGIPDGASVAQIHQRMLVNSDADRGSRRSPATNWLSGSGPIGMREIADLYGLHCLAYEAGADNKSGYEATNTPNQIRANRDAGIKDVILHGLRTNWFDEPDIRGELAMYFVLASRYTRWGSFGLTDDVRNLHTPKLKALYELLGLAEDVTAPEAPPQVEATATAQGTRVRWRPALDNVATVAYRVYDSTSCVATILPGEPLEYTFPNRYVPNANLRVTALDAFTNESKADTVRAAPLRQPDSVAAPLAGLRYQYYEGTSWSQLPDFAALAVRKSGLAAGFDLAPRLRNDDFAFRYQGYVEVPQDGEYTFYAGSDDGSKLYIGTQEVVANDGLHAYWEQSGTIGLKAGKHAVTVVFFERGGYETLHVSYEGPGVPKQLIPAAALWRDSTRTDSSAVFHGHFLLAAQHSGSVLDVWDYSRAEGGLVRQYTRHGDVNQQFAIESVGGGYCKVLSRHSGLALTVQDSTCANEVLIVQQAYRRQDNQQWQITPIGDVYYTITAKCSGKALTVADGSAANVAYVLLQEVVGTGLGNQHWRFEAVESSAVASRGSVSTHEDKASTAAAARGASARREFLYPNPAAAEVTVQHRAATAGRLHIEIHDALGRTVYQTTATVVAGDNALTLRLPEAVRNGYHTVSVSDHVARRKYRLLIAR